ncbi:MAG: recombinase family protein [Oscillospiraceae bacterium]
MQQVLEKRVRTIAPTIEPVNVYSSQYAIKRVAAYCRVSTKQDEQLNSYENQVNYYTERIRREAGWKLAGIYADKGITGTSMKKRDEFNKLIRQCRRGKVDMIIVKSISRFARNTLDCIKITRMLREIKVDVYFEEQNLHSIDPASEFTSPSTAPSHRANRKTSATMWLGKSTERKGRECVLLLQILPRLPQGG